MPSLTDLPGELRNRIYEYFIVATADVPLKINRYGMAAPPPLMQTCTRIRNELNDIYVEDTVPTVSLEAYVKDFDFSHVLAFLKELKPLDNGAERDLRVTITVSESKKQLDMDLFRPWLGEVKDTSAEDCDNGKEDFCTFATVSELRLRIFYRVKTSWKHHPSGEASMCGWHDMCHCVKTPRWYVNYSSRSWGECEALWAIDRAIEHAHHKSLLRDSSLLSLFALPEEARKAIYKHYGSDITTLRINQSGGLVPPSLMQVNRPIKHNMLRIDLHNASDVNFEAFAVNYDFSHIIDFFTRKADIFNDGRVRHLTIGVKVTQRALNALSLASFRQFVDAAPGSFLPTWLSRDTVRVLVGDTVNLQVRFFDYTEAGVQSFLRAANLHGSLSGIGNEITMRKFEQDCRKRYSVDRFRSKWWPSAGFVSPRATFLAIAKVMFSHKPPEAWHTIAVNYASVSGVSKAMRLHAKTRNMRGTLVAERYVRTNRPRGPSHMVASLADHRSRMPKRMVYGGRSGKPTMALWQKQSLRTMQQPGQRPSKLLRTLQSGNEGLFLTRRPCPEVSWAHRSFLH